MLYAKILGWMSSNWNFQSSFSLCLLCSNRCHSHLDAILILSLSKSYGNKSKVSYPHYRDYQLSADLWYWIDTLCFFECLPRRKSTTEYVPLCCSLLPKLNCIQTLFSSKLYEDFRIRILIRKLESCLIDLLVCNKGEHRLRKLKDPDPLYKDLGLLSHIQADSRMSHRTESILLLSLMSPPECSVWGFT